MPNLNTFTPIGSLASRAGSALSDTAKKTIEPFQRTQVQRDAAKALGLLGVTTLGFGGAAALAMSLRRKNERKLLDEQRARALLHVPVYDETPAEKRAFFPWNTVGNGWKALKPIHLPPIVKNHWGKGLGILGGGGLAVAGLATEPQNTEGQGDASPFRRVWNDASGLASKIPGVGGVVDGLRDEKRKLMDLPATIRGEHAGNIPSVPWFVPGAIATTMLGLGTGYTGVNAITDSLAKHKLARKKKKAKESLEAALAAEQHSKLGAAMNEFIDACEEVAPSIKEASLVEWYLAALGAAAVSGGMAGAYNGYQEAGQKHRLAALNRIRHLQLAKRRNEDLMLVPEPRPFPASPAPEKEDIKEPKTAGIPVGTLDRILRNVFYHGPKRAITSAPGLLRKTPGAVRTAIKPLGTFAKQNPMATTLGVGLGASELGGRVLDYNHLPGGDWKPSEWFMRRFRDHRPLNDAMGNPIHGTHRVFSANPKENPEMQWSWNPLAGLGSKGGWRGFGWRFRPKPLTHSIVSLPAARPDAMALVKNNTDPAIIARRQLNGRMNAPFHTQ